MEKIVIHNIHGTGARKSAWPKTQSPFSLGLLKNIDKYPAEVKEFQWSGRNTFYARFSASTDLREKISEDAGCAHVLIGHSHGGNIARYAANATPAGVKCLVITLSTPYISAKRRKHINRIIYTNMRFSLFFSWYLSIISLLSYMFSSHWIIIAASSALIFFISLINQSVFGFSALKSNNFLKLNEPQRGGVKCIVYESPSDEVISILNLSSIIQKLSIIAYNISINSISKYYLIDRNIDRRHLHKYKRGEVREAFSIFSNPMNAWRIVLLFITLEFVSRDKVIDTADIFIFLSPFIMEFLRAICGVAFGLIASIFTMISILPIGRDAFFSAPTLEFAISSSPIGKSEFKTFPYSGFDSLSHSSLHQNRAVTDSIASDINQWIENGFQ